MFTTTITYDNHRTDLGERWSGPEVGKGRKRMGRDEGNKGGVKRTLMGKLFRESVLGFNIHLVLYVEKEQVRAIFR